MLTPPLPEDEADRLSALRALLLLDTPPEQRFDRIVQFAAEEFAVPIALISLVDQNRQWFKARVGLDACETSREVSFCGHAVRERGLLVIENALADTRFADNPLVVGAPEIRFYAGAPLHLGATGSAVGTLCVIDRVPREFDPLDRSILASLRDLAVEEILARSAA